MTALLEARDLCKRFGALNVTNDVTLTLHAGDRHALIGPNGAGKTTLLGLLSGTLSPYSGSVALMGQDVTYKPPSYRVKRGLVRTFQISRLFAGLTVFENLYLPCSEFLGTSSRMLVAARKDRAAIDRADKIIQELGLTSIRDRAISEISYGQQRLVELGIALSLQPAVLLLDEPAAGIPSSETDIILSAIERLPKEIAVLLIEHDMQLVRQFAKIVTVLVSGTVLLSGTPKDVMDSEEVQRVYLGRSGHARFSGDTHA